MTAARSYLFTSAEFYARFRRMLLRDYSQSLICWFRGLRERTVMIGCLAIALLGVWGIGVLGAPPPPLPKPEPYYLAQVSRQDLRESERTLEARDRELQSRMDKMDTAQADLLKEIVALKLYTADLANRIILQDWKINMIAAIMLFIAADIGHKWIEKFRRGR